MRIESYFQQMRATYVATTVGAECVLGASITTQADAEHLQEAYDHFKTEAQNVQADYQPQTVNTDGWQGTQNAWLKLFPAITTLQCFLHGFLKIRDCCVTVRPPITNTNRPPTS